MKISYCSDLHLDIDSGAGFNYELPEADILILAGDIAQVCNLRYSMIGSYLYDNTSNFIRLVADKYKHVLWVPGNHEYYDSSIQQAEQIAKTWLHLEGIDNVAISSKFSTVIEDVLFVGATLWTDFNKENPLDMLNANLMNDYTHIGISDMGIGRSLRPADVYQIHKEHRAFITSELYLNTLSKVVVITHHAPDYESECDEITNMTPMYCCTDMEEIIFNHAPNYWIHGHTHKEVCYNIGETKVVSNPRGYFGYEELAKSFQIKTFEL